MASYIIKDNYSDAYLSKLKTVNKKNKVVIVSEWEGFIEPGYGFAVNVCVYDNKKQAQLARRLVLEELLKDYDDKDVISDIINDIEIVPCNGKSARCVEV